MFGAVSNIPARSCCHRSSNVNLASIPYSSLLSSMRSMEMNFLQHPAICATL